MISNDVIDFLWDLFKALLLVNADFLLGSMALSAVLGLFESLLGIGGSDE